MAQLRQRVQPHRELYALRINSGLSRKDLARRVGVSVEAIRFAELGFTPTVRIQFALAEAFGLKPLDLWPLERQHIGRRKLCQAA